MSNVLALVPMSLWDPRECYLPYVGLEGSSESFVRGGIGKLSSGLIVEASDAETDKVCCVFKADATGTSGSKVDAYSVINNLFLMQMYHSESASLAVTAQTDIGTQYGISKVGHNFYVNKNDVSNKMVEIVDIPVAMISTVKGVKEAGLIKMNSSGHPVTVALGDRYGFVVVRFLYNMVNG